MCKKYFKHFWLIIFSFFILMPKSAYADVGTPLMLLGAGHLLIGNAIIGIFEGLIVAKLFGARTVKSILIMVLANYISMVAGVVGIWSLGGALNNVASINNVFAIILAMLAGSYIATIFIEWPFCFWILKGKEDRHNRAFKASAVINSASYAILIPIYFLVSGTSLMTNVKVDKSLSFLKTRNAWVYFISSEDRALYKIRVNGTAKQKVKEARLTNKYEVLFACSKDGKANLGAYWAENGRWSKPIILLGNLLGATAVSEDCGESDRWHNDEVIDFRSPNVRDWSVNTGSWAIVGLNGENKKTGKSLHIALETPFLMWPISKATVLPEDQVICQVGNQIVLFDLNTRRIGLITFGNSPVVILEE